MSNTTAVSIKWGGEVHHHSFTSIGELAAFIRGIQIGSENPSVEEASAIPEEVLREVDFRESHEVTDEDVRIAQEVWEVTV